MHGQEIPSPLSSSYSKPFFFIFSDWANLPMHLLDSVSDRLVALSDYLRFSVVCKSWYSVAKDNQRHHQFPMLLIPSDKEDTWNVYSVVDNKVLDLQIRLPNKRFCGSSKGWLVTVEENFAITLLNPFSRVIGMEEGENSIIHLPPLEGPKLGREPWAKQCDYFVYKTTISADPILNAEDCIVVVIYEEQCRLAFIRLSKDKAWTYIDNSPGLVQEVLYFGDRYYAVDYWNHLFSFDITTHSNSDIKRIAPSKLLQNVYIKRYLVDSIEKELMMVERHRRHESGKFVTKMFKVFKFKLDDTSKWIEKETLGDVALFVGDNSTVSVVASSFSGCQPNCIYFNDDNHRIENHFVKDFGVYNITTKSISKPYTQDAMRLLEKTKLYPIWVVPTFKL